MTACHWWSIALQTANKLPSVLRSTSAAFTLRQLVPNTLKNYNTWLHRNKQTSTHTHTHTHIHTHITWCSLRITCIDHASNSHECTEVNGEALQLHAVHKSRINTTSHRFHIRYYKSHMLCLNMQWNESTPSNDDTLLIRTHFGAKECSY